MVQHAGKTRAGQRTSGIKTRHAARAACLFLLLLKQTAEAAQQVADRLVAVGIKYIWSFANVALQVPPGVVVQREVIAGGLAMLGVRMKLDRDHDTGTAFD